MAVQWLAITVVPERVGMDNYIPVIDMGMVKEGIAPEKSQEQNQEKIPGDIYTKPFQMTGIRTISNLIKMSAKSSFGLKNPDKFGEIITI